MRNSKSVTANSDYVYLHLLMYTSTYVHVYFYTYVYVLFLRYIRYYVSVPYEVNKLMRVFLRSCFFRVCKNLGKLELM